MDSLPSFLALNTYRRYKQDTDTIATWLATTARKFGFSSDLLQAPEKPVQKSGRLKGNARKQAKKLAGSGAIDGSLKPHEPAVPRYTIEVSDFITMAEYVAGKKTLSVPSSILSTLNRAIKLRKDHSSFYTNQPEEVAKLPAARKSDERHEHFVGVLEKVREVLKPRLAPGSIEPVTPAEYGDKHDADLFTNMFQGLQVQEPSEEFLAAPDVPMATNTPDAIYQLKASDDPLEQYLGIAALLQDLAGIKSAVRQIWNQYLQGEISLTTASVATDIAIELAGQLEEQYLKDNPHQKTTEEARGQFFGVQCVLHGEHPGNKERDSDPINLKRYDLVEFSLLNMHILIDAFGDVIKSTSSHPLFKSGFYGTYNASADRTNMSGPKKFDEDKILLLEIMPDIMLYGKKFTLNGCDAFTKAVLEFQRELKHSLVLDFAAQIHLMIHHILRGKPDQPWATFKRFAHNSRASLEQNMKFHENLRIDTWPKQNDMVLQAIMKRIDETITQDTIQDMKTKMSVQLGVPPETTRSHNFFINHPWLCGSLLFGLKLDMQEVSLGFCNIWGSIKFAAQAYNAVRKEKLLEDRWADMDLAMSLYGQQSIFVGDAPNNVDDYLKRFCLSMGYSARNFAKGRRKAEKAIESSAGPRGQLEAEKISPVAYQLRHGYTEFQSGAVASSLEAVLKVCLENVDFVDEQDKPIAGLQQAHGRVPGRKQYTPGQLLQIICGGLMSEELQLTFDHFRLHRNAWRALQSIDKENHADLVKYYGGLYKETESQLPFVVGYVFMTASGTKQLAGILQPKKEDVVTSKMLVQTAGVFKGMIDSGIGGLEIRILDKMYNIAVEVE
ncbi:hypothetical protein BT63DRAFT_423031 [Microthyrium microscopicum]|uniref:DUF6604 domain-containing protein n=1 Tax=Microthyrium microscopicum TaxID=703497 RepID=A0A6A6UEX4_9PEZI|nr:hypothetical protein BT63DRAFT_423031 [Microthyrium microscopicum]